MARPQRASRAPFPVGWCVGVLAGLCLAALAIPLVLFGYWSRLMWQDLWVAGPIGAVGAVVEVDGVAVGLLTSEDDAGPDHRQYATLLARAGRPTARGRRVRVLKGTEVLLDEFRRPWRDENAFALPGTFAAPRTGGSTAPSAPR